jgi:hypothetical protein
VASHGARWAGSVLHSALAGLVGRVADRLLQRRPPFGGAPGPPPTPLPLTPGDTLLKVTDGITEARFRRWLAPRRCLLLARRR